MSFDSIHHDFAYYDDDEEMTSSVVYNTHLFQNDYNSQHAGPSYYMDDAHNIAEHDPMYVSNQFINSGMMGRSSHQNGRKYIKNISNHPSANKNVLCASIKIRSPRRNGQFTQNQMSPFVTQTHYSKCDDLDEDEIIISENIFYDNEGKASYNFHNNQYIPQISKDGTRLISNNTTRGPHPQILNNNQNRRTHDFPKNYPRERKNSKNYINYQSGSDENESDAFEDSASHYDFAVTVPLGSTNIKDGRFDPKNANQTNKVRSSYFSNKIHVESPGKMNIKNTSNQNTISPNSVGRNMVNGTKLISKKRNDRSPLALNTQNTNKFLDTRPKHKKNMNRESYVDVIDSDTNVDDDKNSSSSFSSLNDHNQWKSRKKQVRKKMRSKREKQVSSYQSTPYEGTKDKIKSDIIEMLASSKSLKALIRELHACDPYPQSPPKKSDPVMIVDLTKSGIERTRSQESPFRNYKTLKEAISMKIKMEQEEKRKQQMKYSENLLNNDRSNGIMMIEEEEIEFLNDDDDSSGSRTSETEDSNIQSSSSISDHKISSPPAYDELAHASRKPMFIDSCTQLGNEGNAAEVTNALKSYGRDRDSPVFHMSNHKMSRARRFSAPPIAVAGSENLFKVVDTYSSAQNLKGISTKLSPSFSPVQARGEFHYDDNRLLERTKKQSNSMKNGSLSVYAQADDKMSSNKTPTSQKLQDRRTVNEKEEKKLKSNKLRSPFSSPKKENTNDRKQRVIKRTIRRRIFDNDDHHNNANVNHHQPNENGTFQFNAPSVHNLQSSEDSSSLSNDEPAEVHIINGKKYMALDENDVDCEVEMINGSGSSEDEGSNFDRLRIASSAKNKKITINNIKNGSNIIVIPSPKGLHHSLSFKSHSDESVKKNQSTPVLVAKINSPPSRQNREIVVVVDDPLRKNETNAIRQTSQGEFNGKAGQNNNNSAAVDLLNHAVNNSNGILLVPAHSIIAALSASNQLSPNQNPIPHASNLIMNLAQPSGSLMPPSNPPHVPSAPSLTIRKQMPMQISSCGPPPSRPTSQNALWNAPQDTVVIPEISSVPYAKVDPQLSGSPTLQALKALLHHLTDGLNENESDLSGFESLLDQAQNASISSSFVNRKDKNDVRNVNRIIDSGSNSKFSIPPSSRLNSRQSINTSIESQAENFSGRDFSNLVSNNINNRTAEHTSFVFHDSDLDTEESASQRNVLLDRRHQSAIETKNSNVEVVGMNVNDFAQRIKNQQQKQMNNSGVLSHSQRDPTYSPSSQRTAYYHQSSSAALNNSVPHNSGPTYTKDSRGSQLNMSRIFTDSQPKKTNSKSDRQMNMAESSSYFSDAQSEGEDDSGPHPLNPLFASNLEVNQNSKSSHENRIINPFEEQRNRRIQESPNFPATGKESATLMMNSINKSKNENNFLDPKSANNTARNNDKIAIVNNDASSFRSATPSSNNISSQQRASSDIRISKSAIGVLPQYSVSDESLRSNAIKQKLQEQKSNALLLAMPPQSHSSSFSPFDSQSVPYASNQKQSASNRSNFNNNQSMVSLTNNKSIENVFPDYPMENNNNDHSISDKLQWGNSEKGRYFDEKTNNNNKMDNGDDYNGNEENRRETYLAVQNLLDSEHEVQQNDDSGVKRKSVGSTKRFNHTSPTRQSYCKHVSAADSPLRELNPRVVQSFATDYEEQEEETPFNPLDDHQNRNQNYDNNSAHNTGVGKGMKTSVRSGTNVNLQAATPPAVDLSKQRKIRNETSAYDAHTNQTKMSSAASMNNTTFEDHSYSRSPLQHHDRNYPGDKNSFQPSIVDNYFSSNYNTNNKNYPLKKTQMPSKSNQKVIDAQHGMEGLQLHMRKSDVQDGMRHTEFIPPGIKSSQNLNHYNIHDENNHMHNLPSFRSMEKSNTTPLILSPDPVAKRALNSSSNDNTSGRSLRNENDSLNESFNQRILRKNNPSGQHLKKADQEVDDGLHMALQISRLNDYKTSLRISKDQVQNFTKNQLQKNNYPSEWNSSLSSPHQNLMHSSSTYAKSLSENHPLREKATPPPRQVESPADAIYLSIEESIGSNNHAANQQIFGSGYRTRDNHQQQHAKHSRRLLASSQLSQNNQIKSNNKSGLSSIESPPPPIHVASSKFVKGVGKSSGVPSDKLVQMLRSG